MNPFPEEGFAARINRQAAHVWMVRTFLKHSPEAEEDEELKEIPRALYDFCLALGPSTAEGDEATFLKLARKKFAKLRAAGEAFSAMQAEVSDHTNFRMAAESLRSATAEIGRLLQAAAVAPAAGSPPVAGSHRGETEDA